MTKLTPYFAIFSSLLIATSLFSLVKFGFKPSIDFVGGTVWQLTGSGLDSQSEAIQQVFSSRSLHLERFQINLIRLVHFPHLKAQTSLVAIPN